MNYYRKLFLAFLSVGCLGFITPCVANPIADAELYSVRTKSSIRYSFYEDDAGSSNGAGFLVDRSMGWILTNAHVSGRGTGDIRYHLKVSPLSQLN